MEKQTLIKTWISSSSQETEALGQEILSFFPKNSIIAFFGELGAGKTTLIKGLGSCLTGLSPYEINSPTFTYLNIYEGKTTLYHFDLYRLKNAQEFIDFGFMEYFHDEKMCCIEWAEKIQFLLPKHFISITIKHHTEKKRKIILNL